MKTRSSPRLSVTILITILAAFLATVGGILGNIAASNIPSFLLPYVRFAWPALGIVFVLGVIVSVIQVRRDALFSASSTRNISPSPTPVLAAQSTSSSEYHSCILSYATEDQDFAEKLHADLTSK